VKKSTKIVTFSIFVLLIVTACLWVINDGSIHRVVGGVIVISEDGEMISEVDLEYLKGLESETFKAVIRSSGNKPVEVEYTGVFLKTILEDKKIKLDDKTRIIVKGVDGYMASLSMEEFERKEIYLAYAMDGKPIKSREQGGYGPFQLVIPGDAFSQRWCKYVCEVEIK